MEQSHSIANYFVQKSLDTGTILTPLKLLKLVYLSHGWYLGLSGEPLIGEGVQAWKYGPVVSSIYHSFKHYKDAQISELYSETILDPTSQVDLVDHTPICKDPSITKFLDKIWDVYSPHDGVQLSALTHASGSPWDIVWNQNGGAGQLGAIIPNNIIRDYYKKKSEKK